MHDDYVMNDAQADAFLFADDLVETLACAMLLRRMMRGEYPASEPATWRDVCEIAVELAPDDASPQRTTCLKFLSEFICRMEKIGVFQVDMSNGCIWRDHTDASFMALIPGYFKIDNADRAARIGRRFLAEVQTRYPIVI